MSKEYIPHCYNQLMEIPDNLKNLYKHWEYHTIKPNIEEKVLLNNEVLNQIYPMIIERMKIWEAKQQDKNPPYTKDPILTRYRFCNVYRELDRQTIEIHTLLKQLQEDFDLWLLNIIFSRMVCNPSTIKRVGFLNYNDKNNKAVYEKLINLPHPKYGVAYIFPVSLINKVGTKTREEFFCFYLPKVIKQCAEIIKEFNKVSVTEALKKVLPTFGLNFKFHWTEILIDVAYQYPSYLDLYKQFPVGPGSVPTMKGLSEEDPETVCQSLIGLDVPEFPYLTYEGRSVWLSTENWEGIGCEFRKYINLLHGIGRKRIYRLKV